MLDPVSPGGVGLRAVRAGRLVRRAAVRTGGPLGHVAQQHGAQSDRPHLHQGSVRATAILNLKERVRRARQWL